MSDFDEAACRARVEKATEGPWVAFDADEGLPADHVSGNGGGWWWVWQESRLPHYGGVMEPESHSPSCNGQPGTCCRLAIGSAEVTDGDDGAQERADAEFIAASRTDVPALLTLLDKARAELAEARAEVERFKALVAEGARSDKHANGYAYVRVVDLLAALAPADTTNEGN